MDACSGFVYATAVMGVTGARDQVGTKAEELAQRAHEHSDLPVGIGLGIRSGDQAAEVAGFADAVIVGSAFVAGASAGTDRVRALATELADGVRRPVRTAV
jgi:tryptophan synthase alpha chain